MSLLRHYSDLMLVCQKNKQNTGGEREIDRDREKEKERDCTHWITEADSSEGGFHLKRRPHLPFTQLLQLSLNSLTSSLRGAFLTAWTPGSAIGAAAFGFGGSQRRIRSRQASTVNYAWITNSLPNIWKINTCFMCH